MQSFGLNKKKKFVRKGEHQIVSQGTRFGMGKNIDPLPITTMNAKYIDKGYIF